MAQLYGPVNGHHYVAWIETDEGLVAIDTGWDVASGKPYEGSDLEALVEAGERQGRPLTHVLLTHDHWDHRLNLPLLRERWPEVRVYAHPNGQTPGVTDPLRGGERIEIGGIEIEVIAAPGHSAARDELCYYLPEFNFLFSGDVAQPQGPSYAYANGVSPVPYFHHGDAYRRTLEWLIALEPQRMRTGHGDFLGPEQIKQWLRVTLATLARIEELALQLVERYPEKEESWIAESIYDQIADERHFGLRAANRRKREGSQEGRSDYETYDLPGLLWAVRAAKQIF